MNSPKKLRRLLLITVIIFLYLILMTLLMIETGYVSTNSGDYKNTPSVPYEDLKHLNRRTGSKNGFWIVLITHSRVNYLQKTISSLLDQPDLKKYSLLISQDGNILQMTKAIRKLMPELKKKLKKVEHLHVQPTEHIRASAKIANNYKNALTTVFNKYKAKYSIIIEDDMIFSPDFLSYFRTTAFLLNDPTVWCISSWNDFGYKHLVDDHNRLFRTQYFPGLGWMINKKIWDEIEKKFPNDLWDEGMRVSTMSKNRDCIVPEISRNRNIGITGANMNPRDFALKIQPMAFNKEIDNQYDLKNLGSPEYEAHMKSLVSNSKFIKNLYEVKGKGEIFTLPFKSVNRRKIQQTLFIPLDEFRSQHQHTVVLKHRGNILVLAHERLSPYLPKKYKIERNPTMKIFAGAKAQSCNTVCKAQKLKCDQEHFDYINNCETLGKFFDCSNRCSVQIGSDIPNFVEKKQTCLITHASSSLCNTRHTITQRLCPCLEE
eukprot:gene10479-3001_t